MLVESLHRAPIALRIHSEWKGWLDANGLSHPRDFLKLDGVVVSGHVGRNVSRIRIAEETLYLKREHRVRLRDRIRSWKDGFGFCSISIREAIVLERLASLDLPGPIPLAAGEFDGQAFLLVQEARGSMELRSLPAIGVDRARQIGRLIARLHLAGIDQPDLFAKHFLINPENGELTILDWQRACLRRRVPDRSKVRSLASLRATCPEPTIPPLPWKELIDAYCAQLGMPSDELGFLVDVRACDLAARPSIRRQQIPRPICQDLVRIQGETVCAIPEIAGELRHPEIIAGLHDPRNDGRSYRFRNGRSGILHVRSHRNPLGRWWSALRGKTWRSPELRQARLLFHLERHGIPAPRLLAYGQTTRSAFCLEEPVEFREAGSADGPALRILLEKIHEAGCTLTGNPFGMCGETAAIARVDKLRLCKRLSLREIEGDRRTIDSLIGKSR